MIRFWVCYFSIFFLTISLLSGQSLVGRKILSQPNRYLKPEYPETPSKWEDKSRSQNIWTVYNDRENNPTYKSPDIHSKVLKKLPFGATFYVIGDTLVGDTASFVELIAYNTSIVTISYTLKAEPEYYGWIPASKLLLWTNCLTFRNSNCLIKALIINKLENLVTDKVTKQPLKKLLFAKNPAEADTFKSVFANNAFECFFVFKKEGNSVLLGRKSVNSPLNNMGGQPVLLGWLPANLIHEWKNYVCIAPNENVDEQFRRDANKIKPTIWASYEEASNYQDGIKLDDKFAIWKEDIADRQHKLTEDEQKNLGQRFPIFEYTYYDDTIHVGALVSIKQKKGVRVSPHKDIKKMQQFAHQISAETRKTNFIFVIDGRDSTKHYTEIISEKLAEYLPQFEEDSLPIHWGIVLYSESDERKPLIIQLPLTNQIEVTDSFIGSLPICRQREEENTSLVAGVKAGLDMLKGKENENNVFLVLGNTGSFLEERIIEETFNSAEEDTILNENVVDEYPELTLISDELAKYNCHLHIYQNKSSFGVGYQNFVKETLILFISSRESINGKISKKIGEDIFNGAIAGTPYFSNPYIDGTLFHLKNTERLDENKFTEELDSVFSKIYRRVEDSLKLKIAMDFQFQKRQVYVHPWIYENLKELPNVTDDFFYQLASDSVSILLDGFTTQRIGNVNRLYQYELFLHEDELFYLLNSLNLLIKETETAETPQKALLKICYKILEGDSIYKKYIDRDFVQKKEITDILNITTRMYPSTEGCGQSVMLKDIEKLTTKEAQDILECIKERIMKLKLVSKDKRYYFVNSFEQTYFWIPQSFIP